MPRNSDCSRLTRVADLVDTLARNLDGAALTARQCRASLVELDAMCATLSNSDADGADALISALQNLRDTLLVLSRRRARRVAGPGPGRRLTQRLKRIGLIIAGAALLATPMAAAAQTPTPTSAVPAPSPLGVAAVGDIIVHPVTGELLTVTSVEDNGVVVTGDIYILTTTGIGEIIADPADPDNLTVTIDSVRTNGTTMLVDQVTFTDGRTLDVVTVLTVLPDAGDPDLSVPAGVSNQNNRSVVQNGSGGRGGRAGALFVSARAGGSGGTGPTLNETFEASNGNITTVTAGTPGIIVASIGGNGGRGGTSYLGSGGASGGSSGAGGSATLVSRVGTISTSGDGSHGLVVQSRAGRGGRGGGSIGFSSGGSGGVGGTGGTVSVTNHGSITTRGAGSHGVYAQSLGGAAGDGGSSYGITGDGGEGNSGGNGGQAEAINHGTVTTFGNASFGVAAQSVGGIGGDSGDAGGIVTFTSDGAPGGNGGAAIVRAGAGSIVVTGARDASGVVTGGGGSHGLFAQSVGGGGGSGGLSAGLVSLGSGGAAGGTGGRAEVHAASGASITTNGQFAHGIFAQSVGGGGGNSGVSAGAVAFGASGAGGGSAGDVFIESGADIETTGLGSRGIFGQSVGGGGGSGMGTGGLVALGGSGGGGGNGGTVTISTITGSTISTDQRGGDGIFAQSVGGGGGSGSSSGGLVSLGGSGAGGGNGGVVSVTNVGGISTAGDLARGIFAQSVGGGGGSGGDGGGLVTLGGRGSTASSGAAVTVTNAGAITTSRNRSSAIQAQSVGGGGGDGGSAAGAFAIGGGAGGGGGSGLVTVNNSHDLTTSGNDSHGIFAQSVGGGGGNGGSATSVSAFAGAAIGGTAGNGGNGGRVDINLSTRMVPVGGILVARDPVISTFGDRSRGVFAQSVGGGGGNGGFAVQGTASFIGAASLALGGSGGLGGTGDLVTVDGRGTFLTDGDYSEGLFAQSVGGGGGNGGFAVSVAVGAGPVGGSLSLAIGGSGGSGGVGGQVDVNSGGMIDTLGDYSTGLFAQSVGGGGGNGGYTVSIAAASGAAGSVSAAVGIGGSGGSGGAGGRVDVDFDGSISTAGHDAGGALIQSVGGGGGNGGFNVSGAVSGPAGVSGAVSVGIGGSGGSGGAGGTATGHVLGAVQTLGDRSTGVVVQSVGGGGGNGGFNVSGSVAAAGGGGGALGVGLGGSGGGGGAGGSATGSTGGTVMTFGDQSGGLLVQSVGGGGGNGGFNVTGSIGAGGSFGGAGAFGMGGSGGGGGAGGQVRGDALGRVHTEGFQSTGVVVQSVGGGGGNGGFNVSGAIGGSGSFGGAVTRGLGGSGGGGGHAGEVDASAVGITTLGHQSGGFLAQSVGGGGGAGGFNISGGIAGSGNAAGSVTVGLGGAGGGGGDGRRVGASVLGDVTTLGDQSDGVVVQSVGGGGGNGGFNVSGSIAAAGGGGGALGVGLGGSGGGGGAGGSATGSTGGTVMTFGDQSGGLLVQSVGGGGGNGGFNVTGSIGAGGSFGGAGAFGMGGSGGGGGAGGQVRGDALGRVHTEGFQSTGVVVQSVGGGGGNGGFNVSGSIGGGGSFAAAVAVGLGGSGGGGGHAGEVDASAVGISTVGDQSGGFLAQSVGGGGGAGGFNISGGIAGSGSAAGSVTVGLGGAGGGGGVGRRVGAAVTGDVTTLGDQSDAIMAQSLGGGGGSGGFNVSGSIAGSASGAGSVSVGLGGSGGGGGDAGAVALAVIGMTRTAGLDSDGIIAQSVGGGGGSGGFNISGGITVSGGAAGTVGVGIGGSGGAGGDGGSVVLDVNTGVADAADTLLAVHTEGDGGRGIVAQSIGGGGGNGGFNITGTVTASRSAAGNVGVGIGGSGGSGGDAGAVTARINGDVLTEGDDASAILVQSVGGGGGNGGFNITAGLAASQQGSGNLLVGIGGLGGGGGNGGAVRATMTSDIETSGDGAFGATVQSLGGGGGNGGFNITAGVSLTLGSGVSGNLGFGVGGFGGQGGTGGNVVSSLTGDVLTRGAQAHGALFQSVGGGGGAGGFNITGGLSAGSGVAGTIGIGLGGFGGGGGDAGTVDGILIGNVTTLGDGSFGAMIQSIGGGGGTGGMNITGAVALTAGNNAAVGVGFGLGGFGGLGGDGAGVGATVTGRYSTSGKEADGVVVQSLGGGGGAGGLNVAGSVAVGAGNSGTASIGIGGFGGGGGNSGSVALTRVGDTFTDGADSDGIIVQSVAGGGGAGGMNISGGIAATTSGNAGAFGFGLGGFGGDGGDAGTVRANIQGNVVTVGLASDVSIDDQLVTINLGPLFDNLTYTVVNQGTGRQRLGGSNGVVVQSQGGGGGIGGINITGQLAVGGASGRAVSLGIGGFGGGGGDAGSADLTIGSLANHVQIYGIGDGRTAVIVQSVGGGGGVGGINVAGGVSTNGNLVAGIGGFGGDGGLGRAVTASINADLFAAGNLSRGLLAQSVGGGGGYGGINISGGINAAGSANAGNDSSLVFGLGGFGGDGNRSGDVTVTHNGQVSVEGQGSVGLLVQSVAGGGGSGGINVSGNLALGASDGFGVAIGIGGSGGTGADAGIVRLTNSGNIFARTSTEIEVGASALDSRRRATSTAGIIAQSIGGGGGQGGINITGAIARNGSPIAIGVGGSGGSGGNANEVRLVRGYINSVAGLTAAPGLIRTYGNEGVGLLAQSVGGGGGNAGVNLVLAGSLGGDTSPVSAIIAVGGSGAGAGVGKAVSVVHNGDIVTDGNSSGGLLAQSLGGGGGNANFNIGFGYVRGASALNLAVGGATGAAGRGGTVLVNHSGRIITSGDDSAGLTAQSIGGGGGNAATNMAMALGARNSFDIAIGRLGGSGGEGGDVEIFSSGYIYTTGSRSSGIVGQSVGGGGGISGASSIGASHSSGTGSGELAFQGALAVGLTGGTGATSGRVDITSDGTVVTRGERSHAIHAQSTGGGGGIGGSVMNTLISQSGSFTVGVGGDGGSGNNSGVVTATSNGTLITTGAFSDGIFAQSIGGGGGQGGYSALIASQVGGASSNGSGNLAVNVGGSGGNGSSGAVVHATNRGAISTSGERSFGIRAQSIGGGGGDGGMVVGLRAQGSGHNLSAEFRVGGSGGSAGAGRDVNVLNEGLIVTTGRESAGISANSIGGGGGNGGLVVDAVVGAAGAGNITGRFIVNIGGSGGTGGTSGNVAVTNRTTTAVGSGTILTSGADAYGILAQSLSGGGGNGSSVILLTGMNNQDGYSGTFGLNIGGTGGAANQAGTVTVTNGGIIETRGAGAHGILAQSIGGGGGNGGLSLAGSLLIGAASNSSLVSIGGVGGVGGNANTVTVNNAGNVLTRGIRAHGVFAQSIGGGGGNANMGISTGGNINTAIASRALSAIVGGVNSGTGGLGGTVTVNHSGDITVLGNGSQAIKAESINGGGGSLTFDFAGIISVPGRPGALPGGGPSLDPLVAARLGGQAVSGMSGGLVTVNSTGTFGAGGDNGAGTAAQSIGGGGGTADVDLNLGNLDPTVLPASAPVDLAVALGGTDGVNNRGGDIGSTHGGNILTTGTNSPGVLMQSIGGGGGRSSVSVAAPAGSALGSVNLTLGGTNGTNETGGAVSRAQTGQVVSTGNLSPAVHLQSIGGGGGSTGLSLSGSASLSSALYTTLGATGGVVLDGGAVSGNFNGGITTAGNYAIGLLAQSIGAGGGDVRASGGAVLNATLGGRAGAAGNGGSVSLVNIGTIQTAGAGSHGVLLQSIGGGGGSVLTSTTVRTLSLSNQNSGHGGTINFLQTGNIIVAGTRAYGVIAQSLGGGGGWVEGAFAGTAGGTGLGGAINLNVSGDIFAAYAGSTGILAQSLGRNAAGNITAVVAGQVRGGSGSGIGVSFDGGLNNRLVTSGSISAVSGLAINATFGNDAVSNTGLVVGNIDLGSGSNAFNNETGATFVAFNTIDLRDPVAPPAPLAPVSKDGDPQVLPALPIAPAPTAAKPTDTGPQILPAAPAPGGSVDRNPQVLPATPATPALTAAKPADTGPQVLPSAPASGKTADNGPQVLPALSATPALTVSKPTAMGPRVLPTVPASGGSSDSDPQVLPALPIAPAPTAAKPADTGPQVLPSAPASGKTADNGPQVLPALSATPALTVSKPTAMGPQVLPTVPISGGSAYSDPQVIPARPTTATLTVRGSTDSGSQVMSMTPASGGSVEIDPQVLPALPIAPAPTAAKPADTGPQVLPSAPASGGSSDSDPQVLPALPIAPAPTAAKPADTGPQILPAAPAPGGSVDSNPQVLPALPIAPAPTLAKPTDTGPQVLPSAPASDEGSVELDTRLVLPAMLGEASDAVFVAGFDGPAAFAPGADPLAVPLPPLAATFSNAGNFVMGLSASRRPIDLANGDVFGNLDGEGTPETNLLYGARVTNTVELDGNYLQTAGGNLVFDVAFGPYASDVVNVSGNTTVDGTGQVILTWLENRNPYTLFATAGTAVDNGLEIDDTLAIDFGIVANDIGIQLTIATDFAQPFLNTNEQALGRHMDSAITVGGSGGIGRLMALIGNLQVGEKDLYKGIFDQLNPEPHLAPMYRQLVGADDFSSELFSCPGQISRLESQCVWARVETASSERGADSESFAVEGQTVQFRGGFEHRLDSQWSLAGAVGYDRLDRMHIDGYRARTDGDGVHAGLGLRRVDAEGVDLGVSLSGGWQWLETSRQLTVFEHGVGVSHLETGYLQGEVHLARTFEAGPMFARPALNGSLTALRHNGLTETGLEGLGVQVLDDTQYVGTFHPELTLGLTLQDNADGYAAATLSVGKVFRSTDRLTLPIRLLGSNSDADPAMIGTPLDRQAMTLATELRLAHRSGLEVRLGYSAEMGDHVDNHTAGISLKIPF